MMFVSTVLHRYRDAAAVGGLLILSMVFFAQALFTDRVLYYGDFVATSYPHHDLWAEAIRRREMPLWNPYAAGGRPFLADSLFSPLYPSMLLSLVFPVPKAVAVDVTLHVWAAGVLAYVFLRRGHLLHAPAFLGACVFALGGFVIAHTQHLSFLRALAWMPLVLLLTREIPERPWPYTVPRLAFAVALTILAGHLQVVLITLMLAALLAIHAGKSKAAGLRNTAGAALRALVTMCSGALLGCVAAAVVLLPALELASLSRRAEGLAFTTATSFSLPRRGLLLLAFPNFFGTPANGSYIGPDAFWEMTGTAGVVSLLLAALGIACGRRADRWFWAAIVALALVLAMGHNTPVYSWLLAVFPVLRYFRVPPRFLLWSSFALAVLTAYGTEWLGARAGHLESRRARAIFGGALTLVVLVSLYLITGSPGFERALRSLQAPFAAEWEPGDPILTAAASTALKNLRLAGMFLGGSTLLLLLVMLRRISRSVATVCIGLLLVGELYMFGANFYPTAAPGLLTPVRLPFDLGQDAYRIATSPEFIRAHGGLYMHRSSFQPPFFDPVRFSNTLIPNMGVLEEVADISTHNTISIRHIDEFTGWTWSDFREKDGRSPLLDFFGARYVYDSRPNKWATPVDNSGGVVWRNPSAMPRGWLVTTYQLVKTPQEMQKRLRETAIDSSPVFSPARTVFLYDYDAPREIVTLRGGEGGSRILRREYRLNTVSFDVRLTEPVLLVLNDTYYPGWRAYVDGHDVPIHRANHAFRAIFLQASARRVDFVFQPRSVHLGLAISTMTTLLLLWWVQGSVGRWLLSTRRR